MDKNDNPNRWMLRTNYFFSLFFVALGLLMLQQVSSNGYQFYGQYAPESGFFPTIIAILLIVTGGILLMQTLRGRYSSKTKAYPSREKLMPMLLFAVLVFVALLLVKVLGLTICLFLIFFGIMLAIYRYKPVYSLCVSALAVAVIYLVFVIGFAIRFPVGFLGF